MTKRVKVRMDVMEAWEESQAWETLRQRKAARYLYKRQPKHGRRSKQR